MLARVVQGEADAGVVYASDAVSAGDTVTVFGLPMVLGVCLTAGVLLLSQRFHSSRVMSLVDWELLVLFMGLFVVNHALALTGATQAALAAQSRKVWDTREALRQMLFREFARRLAPDAATKKAGRKARPGSGEEGAPALGRQLPTG